MKKIWMKQKKCFRCEKADRSFYINDDGVISHCCCSHENLGKRGQYQSDWVDDFAVRGYCSICGKFIEDHAHQLPQNGEVFEFHGPCLRQFFEVRNLRMEVDLEAILQTQSPQSSLGARWIA